MAQYLVHRQRMIARNSVYSDEEKRERFEWVPEPGEVPHPTVIEAKAVFMRSFNPNLQDAPDEFAVRHFDAQARNLGHYKVFKVAA